MDRTADVARRPAVVYDGASPLHEDIEQDIIGGGWSFPVQLNGRGSVALTSGVHTIERAIRIILLTAKGERAMRPEFGSDLHRLVFAENNATTAGYADFYVREALAQWEPRIEVEDVQVSWSRSDRGMMLIEIEYRIRQTNDVRNLVFPFYTIPEEGE